ncbi:hypothetical protein U1839_02975 [Sphingomonas sp. RT2P30]|uniref:hypothetical protein n=1 Tax=Parasphingomonas halimpatiens TaxID=3096162 RepID=UPI002FC9E8D0
MSDPVKVQAAADRLAALPARLEVRDLQAPGFSAALVVIAGSAQERLIGSNGGETWSRF